MRKMCKTCRGPMEPGLKCVNSEACRRKRRAQMAAFYARRAAAGLCRRCGRPRPPAGRSTLFCDPCMDAHNAYYPAARRRPRRPREPAAA